MNEMIGGKNYHFPDRKCVFICSPYSGNIEENVEKAKKYARYATLKGNAVFVPHLLYTQFLDDSIESERIIGIQSGIEFLWFCDEIWVFAKDEDSCSSGMKTEIEEAKKNSAMKILYIDPETIDEGDEMMSMTFNQDSRKQAIRDILADFKTRIDAEDNEIFASYEAADYLKEGFGFRFKIYMTEDGDEQDIDSFYQAKDFLANMFGYLFNGKLDVSCSVDESKYEAEYEIVSEI